MKPENYPIEKEKQVRSPNQNGFRRMGPLVRTHPACRSSSQHPKEKVFALPSLVAWMFPWLGEGKNGGSPNHFFHWKNQWSRKCWCWILHLPTLKLSKIVVNNPWSTFWWGEFFDANFWILKNPRWCLNPSWFIFFQNKMMLNGRTRSSLPLPLPLPLDLFRFPPQVSGSGISSLEVQNFQRTTSEI